MAAERLSVSLFCGGRGGATIIRELLKHTHIELNLLVNAYDDGLSTGELRRLVPGMLGPSDFRKNLSRLLDFSSPQHFVLEKLLEHRFAAEHAAGDVERLRAFVGGEAGALAGDPVGRWFSQLEPPLGAALKGYIAKFLDYHSARGESGGLPDFALGNLIFAGAYLTYGRFNEASARLARLFASRANLINVTPGDNRILVAVKEDGELLDCEAAIVGRQSASPIAGFFLLKEPLSPAQRAELAPLDAPGKARLLASWEAPVSLSPESAAALGRSDLIVYGPGTMYSSLFPSYRTRGLAEAVAASPAAARVFVVNVEKDHDIQALSARRIVGQALEILGDPRNARRLITHVVYNDASDASERGVPFGAEEMDRFLQDAGIACIRGNFAHPARPQAHSGSAVVRRLLAILDEQRGCRSREIDIYVDLHERSVAVEHIIEDFLELDWKRYFDKARLRINCQFVAPRALPAHLEIVPRSDEGLFPEVGIFFDWLASGSSGYLATITGDGGYSLRDVLEGVDFLRFRPFGAIFGSRNQSRRQFTTSLVSAYGEGNALFVASWLGAFFLSALFGLRFNVIFSDPLTGFRIYKRSALPPDLARRVAGARCSTASGLTRLLVKNRVEIAEIPVRYRTFRGFTNVRWRLRRGLRNLFGACF